MGEITDHSVASWTTGALDLSNAPISIVLTPSDLRFLFGFVKAFQMTLPGFPSNAQWEELLTLRRIREAFDLALSEAGLPGLEAPGGERDDQRATV